MNTTSELDGDLGDTMARRKSKTYTLHISDGMSLNGGGTKTVVTDSLAQARIAWVEWAQTGDYESPEGTDVKVYGSIWLDGSRVADVVTLAPACAP